MVSAGEGGLVAHLAFGGSAPTADASRVVTVTGLAYVPSAHAIVLSEGETPITCAESVGGAIVATGACRIDATIEPRSIDTGFGVAVRDHLIIRIARSR